MFPSITFLLSVILKPTAYLDPGSGSFIIQLMFGAVVGGLVVLRAYWSKIRTRFNKSDKETTADDQATPESSEDVQEKN